MLVDGFSIQRLMRPGFSIIGIPYFLIISCIIHADIHDMNIVLLLPSYVRLNVHPVEITEELPDLSDTSEQVTPIVLDERKLADLNGLSPYLFPVSILCPAKIIMHITCIPYTYLHGKSKIFTHVIHCRMKAVSAL